MTHTFHSLACLIYTESKKDNLKESYMKKTRTIFKFVMLSSFLLIATFYAEAQKVTLAYQNTPFEQVLNAIRQQTGLSPVFSEQLVDLNRQISINVSSMEVTEALKLLLANTNVDFEIKNDKLYLVEKTTDNKKPVSSPATLRKIAGTVKDPTGEPVIGATVVVKGSQAGTVTDIDGNFKLDVRPDATLEISYLGFQAQEIRVSGRSSFNITLQEDNQLLSEVVVVAYGTQKKESLSGAIASVRADEIVTTKAPSLAQSIQGKVAGLHIRQGNAQPGWFKNDINIRGLGTPLFIIDGVVRDGGAEFQRLNADDIESITFLKDGTAAIYGMNSSNGAILVTTKQGKQGKMKLSLSSNFGFNKPTNLPQMANAAQYQELRNDATLFTNGLPYMSKDELDRWKTGGAGYESYDFYSNVYKSHSTQQRHTLSFSGGSKDVDFYGSFGYTQDGGLLKSNDMNYDQYSVRSNVNMKITNDLSANINIHGRTETRTQPTAYIGDIFRQSISTPAYYKVYANDNPAYINKFPYGANPLATSQSEISGSDVMNQSDIQSGIALNYAAPWLKGFNAKVQLFYDIRNFKAKVSSKPYNLYEYTQDTQTGEDIYNPTKMNNPGYLRVENGDFQRLDFQGQLNYNNTFNKHHIGATFVYEIKRETSSSTMARRLFDVFLIDDLNLGRDDEQFTEGISNERAFISYIGRINYDYSGKYLTEVAFRQDGSYRYAPGKRWAFFPTASAGWRISEENFIKQNLSFVDNIKLRASIGLSGEDAGDEFAYMMGYNLNQGLHEFEDGKPTKGVNSVGIINPNLTWYRAKIYNIGFDFSIFDGKLSLEADIYQRDRTGLLANRVSSVPNTFGGEMPQENLNSDRVRGVEFTIGHKNKIESLYYNIKGNFNLSRRQNRHQEEVTYNSSWERWKNQSSNRWTDFTWGYNVIGQFQNSEEISTSPVQHHLGNTYNLPGDYIYEDVNGDGIINDNDLQPMFWSSTPLLHYGLTIEMQWKNFDFYTLFQGSAGFTAQLDGILAHNMYLEGNAPAYFYDRWRLSDPYDLNSDWISGTWPAPRFGTDKDGGIYRRNSTIWTRNASYLRWKTIEIGYSIDPKLLKKSKIEKLRFYVNGNNILTFTDSFLKPFDPERLVGESTWALDYPLQKSFNFGFNLTF